MKERERAREREREREREGERGRERDRQRDRERDLCVACFQPLSTVSFLFVIGLLHSQCHQLLPRIKVFYAGKPFLIKEISTV
jgi:hypothetical protein